MSARLLVAGTASGTGKTTVTAALCAAFRRRGLGVQPFKAGPDYIDPTYHTQASGRACRNLDSFLLEPAMLRAVFARAAARADLSVIEGVMGLYDGRDGTTETGSTAEIAKLLDAPVVVVLDVGAQARTAAAIALGCVRFDPRVRIAGFVLERVGSDTHARWVTDAIEDATGLPVLGALRRDASLALPERHLGLIPTTERALAASFIDRLADVAEASLALDRLRAIAASAPDLPPAPSLGARGAPLARIAIARDEAFGFYYEDALELLELAGAELVPFSPLADRALPPAVGGLYVGGGFPELYAERLSANEAMRAAIVATAARGVAVVAECGGLMYLGRALIDRDGVRREMAGVVPIETAMRADRPTLGYRTLTARRDGPLLARGETVRAHEFHYSEQIGDVPADNGAFDVAERPGTTYGYATPTILASYMHVHFGSMPAMARRFVSASSAAGILTTAN
ncbi:MAG: cobyrinate a,c-diamide synthase [Chloroflexota bacterium]|nr:cobyrinate a,c-diamide synthase [Chloroflexota bacterium]MDE3194566.1 cobyrinate a,c-diamide synthase [Chloroflexota bacterium]